MSYNPYAIYEPNFGIGARVKLIRQRKYPDYKLLNLVGTVRTDSGNNVSVIFDTVTNTRSAYGCFYFKAVDLVEADEHADDIKEEENMSKITNYLNIAKIRAINDTKSNPYIFEYANFDPDLTVGDLCVVTGIAKPEEGSQYFRGMSVAVVVSIEDRNDIELAGEIVTKVNDEQYNERIKRRIKMAELKSKMEARAKQLQDIALYQMLAKDDSDMMNLLNEYQSLSEM